jgi:ferredoxin-NADP reductase
VAGTALLGRLVWYVATVVEQRKETETARTLVLRVPGWPGHEAGQHVDARLRAEDGYTAVRSYSIANAAQGDRLELTVELLVDGEVSPYLVETIAPGDTLEIRGPVGGWFVWQPTSQEPVQLVAGGSGIVPLMAMIRTRIQAGVAVPFRLLYSVRNPGAVIYGAELERRAAEQKGLNVTYAYTRAAPAGWPRPPGRIDDALIAEVAFPPSENPSCYICGPTAFVENASALLGRFGYPESRIKTERFGPSGGTS